MLAKEKRLLITFRNSVEVMRMQETAQSLGLPGRIIPVPSSVAAGCGLCYMAVPEARERLVEMMRARGIAWEREVEVML